MMREKIKKETIETIKQHNTEILAISNCIKKMKYGKIREYGIEWESVEDFMKELKEICAVLESVFYYFNNNKVIVLVDMRKVFE